MSPIAFLSRYSILTTLFPSIIMLDMYLGITGGSFITISAVKSKQCSVFILVFYSKSSKKFFRTKVFLDQVTMTSKSIILGGGSDGSG